MTKGACKCCYDDKIPPKLRCGGRWYNKVRGTSAKWVRKNGEPKSEFTVPVVKGQRFSGYQWQKDRCGDGTFGFSTRRRGRDECKMDRGLDGQWKKKRATLVNGRSARAVTSRRARTVWGTKCLLWSVSDINRVQVDSVIATEREVVEKKSCRRRNRNRRAARGHKRTTRVLV